MNEELLQKVVDLAMALGKGSSVLIQANCCWQGNKWQLAGPEYKNRNDSRRSINEPV